MFDQFLLKKTHTHTHTAGACLVPDHQNTHARTHARVRAHTQEGTSALDLAIKWGYTELAALLRAATQ